MKSATNHTVEPLGSIQKKENKKITLGKPIKQMIMDEEVKIIFELAFLPIVAQNQRLNGEDFMRTAVPIMNELSKQLKDESENSKNTKLRKAAFTMVHTFNNMLNPKMPNNQCESIINMLSNGNPILSMFL